MQDTKNVVTVSTNIGTTCSECDFLINPQEFDKSVNHYINEHGYTLLHVGTETDRDYKEAICHSTVAVLGKP